jgi:hypothetical protein
MSLTSLIAALVPLAFADPAAPDPSTLVVTDSSGPVAKAEYFLISEEVAATDDAEGASIAVVALRRIDRTGGDLSSGPASLNFDFLLEREVTFAEGGLRVRHTESGLGSTRRLVWREFLPKESRTWVADWTAGVRGAPARSIGYGWNRPVHEQVMGGSASDTTLYGPLELLYGMRDGSLPCGEASGVVGVIDPASASIVQVEQSLRPSAGPIAGAAMDLRRPDGSLLLGADVARAAGPASGSAAPGFTALRMSDRPTTATRIDRAEYDRLSRRWTVETMRPYEAVLALIPKRH